jgi:predicted HTH transcriptional regulator
MDDAKLIKNLLVRSEGKALDFKSSPIIVSDPKHIARFIKNLICMANTPRVGSAFIISGVVCKPSGKKEIVGLSETEHPDDANLQEIIKGKVEPIPEFYYRPVSYGGSTLGILEISPRKGGPFMPRFEYPNVIIQGPVYFRRGSSNAIASSAELREIIDWMEARERPSKPFVAVEVESVYEEGGGTSNIEGTAWNLWYDIYLNVCITNTGAPTTIKRAYS